MFPATFQVHFASRVLSEIFGFMLHFRLQNFQLKQVAGVLCFVTCMVQGFLADLGLRV